MLKVSCFTSLKTDQEKTHFLLYVGKSHSKLKDISYKTQSDTGLLEMGV
jgi:hypothetical protein